MLDSIDTGGVNIPSTNTTNVDSDVYEQYNDNIKKDNGGNINGSQNTDLLAGRKVSAANRSGNVVRQQGNDSSNVRGRLGVLSQNQKDNDRLSKNRDSGWLSRGNFESSQTMGGGPKESFLRALRNTRPSGIDTKGRVIDQRLQEKLADTVFKTENGSIMVLYHWTPNLFNDFKYGDGAFHLGTFNAALSIKSKSQLNSNGY